MDAWLSGQLSTAAAPLKDTGKHIQSGSSAEFGGVKWAARLNNPILPPNA
jgi:hypothetical protein